MSQGDYYQVDVPPVVVHRAKAIEGVALPGSILIRGSYRIM